ncbi:LA_3696 family protein [Leptospira sanjuanensis]|uniref:LA_3696 family protein n=1 Tax=Leptospira sanjuanensis TaxID=2879643 RepID=UPI001EE83151|nr:hypothetical protein [Leptospira sanjuanensis]MCG6166339.1 hypothetical protein [Leptospira sanjuanensis]
MMSDLVHKIPPRLEEILGSDGKEQFLVFLNEAFMISKNLILEAGHQRFETTLKSEISKIEVMMETFKTNFSGNLERLQHNVDLKIVKIHGEISELRAELKVNVNELHSKILFVQHKLEMDVAELRQEMGEFRMELKDEIAVLRTELKTDMANLRAEWKSDLLEVQKSIVDIHRAIAFQTRWILAGMVGVATLSAAIGKLIH